MLLVCFLLLVVYLFVSMFIIAAWCLVSVIGLTVWHTDRLVGLFGLDGLVLLLVDCLIVASSLDLWVSFWFWFV